MEPMFPEERTAAEKKVWVRPEVTGVASLQAAQSNKYYTGSPESNANQTGPAS